MNDFDDLVDAFMNGKSLEDLQKKFEGPLCRTFYGRTPEEMAKLTLADAEKEFNTHWNEVQQSEDGWGYEEITEGRFRLHRLAFAVNVFVQEAMSGFVLMSHMVDIEGSERTLSAMSKAMSVLSNRYEMVLLLMRTFKLAQAQFPDEELNRIRCRVCTVPIPDASRN